MGENDEENFTDWIDQLGVDEIVREIKHDTDIGYYLEDGKFKAPILAGNIAFKLFDIKDHNCGINRGWLVIKDTKEIYRFNGGYYEPDGEEVIRDVVQSVIGTSCKEYWKKEVVSWIRDNTRLHVFRDLLKAEIHHISLENGVYNLKTGKLEEHSPGHLFTYQIPILYDPDARCPNFKKFLKDILYLEDIPLIQELFGYCLYREYFIHKAFIFVGEGRNGKSTLINVLARFLREENISSIPLQTICKDRFGAYDLYGKMANLCSDLSSYALSDTGIFKMATGGDFIRAQKKFKNSFKFINYAKLVFSCNVIPESKDQTSAYTKRWIPVEFPNTFEGVNCDKHILKKITTDKELSGIFNWAIEGLKRLLKNQDFSPHRTLEDVKRFQAEQQNPVVMFINTHIERNSDSELTKEEVYEKFLNFCKRQDIPTKAGNVFSRDFKQYAPFGLGEGQSRLKGRKKTWKGIQFKKDNNKIEKEGIEFYSENVNDVND